MRAVLLGAGGQLSSDLLHAITEAFATKARQPAYSVLAYRAPQRLSCHDLPSRPGALRRYLIEKGNLAANQQEVANPSLMMSETSSLGQKG